MKKTILTITAAVAVTLAVQNFFLNKTSSTTPQKESAYDRVMRTNTLRCAYGIYPPFYIKDPNTGKLSGIAPDIMAEFEKTSGVKVEWGPETDWGDISLTLQTGKADAFCGMFLTPKRARTIAGTIPIFYGILAAYVRPDDKRFDNNPDRINQPDVRISANEGDFSEEVAMRMFPQAQRIYKGTLGGEDALFLNVATNKADVVLSAPSNLSIFNKNNPNTTLRRVEFNRTLAGFASVIGIDMHNQDLLPFINANLRYLVDNGVTERILLQYLGQDYGVSWVAAKPQLN